MITRGYRVRAGEFRHSVQVLQRVEQRDTIGASDDKGLGQETSQTTESYTYASIEPLTGEELEVARKQDQTTTHRIRLRYSSQLSSIKSSWRIYDFNASIYYQVNSAVCIDNKKKIWEIMAKQIVSQ